MIHQAAQLRRVNRASGFVPGEITGELPHGQLGGGRPIAVVVNGTIAATGWTFSLEGSSVENFEAIVPERAFRRGANDVRVFEIVARQQPGAATALTLPTLRGCSGAPNLGASRYSRAEGGDKEVGKCARGSWSPRSGRRHC